MLALVQIVILFFLLGAPAAWADDFTAMLVSVNEHHPALLAERASLEASQTGVDEAYAGFLPGAAVQYDHGRQRVQYNALPSFVETTNSRQLTVSQPVFNGGGTLADVRLAKARLDGATAHYRQVQQQVLLNAIAAYIDIVEKQRVLDMTRDNIKALTKHLDATRKQFAAGELTITDVSQSEARLARAKAELHDAEAALEDAHDAYVRETGEQPSAKEFPKLPAVMVKSEQEVTDAIGGHPAVVEARDKEKVADSTVDQRVAATLPSVRLQGQLSDMDGSSTPSIFSTNDRSLLVRVSIPLDFADIARVGEARSLHTQAKHEVTDTARDTLKTALREWHNYVASGDAIEEHEQAVKAGRKALDSVHKEQIAGTRTVLDVLNGQDELYTAEVSLVRAQSRHILSAYRTLAALGRLDEILPVSRSTD